jgi:hypothetical protein
MRHNVPVGPGVRHRGRERGAAEQYEPCLEDEISSAQFSVGGTRQPKASLYVNTADPGNHGVTDWPASNTDPVFGNHDKDPYGTCRGGNSRACAWQYGWNMALMDARTRAVQSPGRYRWWLDLETANSWQSSTRNNRADLEAMAFYFRHIGAKVGIYSGEQRFLLPCSAAEGESQAIVTALARCRSA